ncbi:MAG TPA: hypothetical protein DCX89_05850 [Saprospirales bacterium]|nr:hypothetical protein [Saprospirales bacterium]HAY71396.1 hypothetical protein [Saprospirales bacterium]
MILSGRLIIAYRKPGKKLVCLVIFFYHFENLVFKCAVLLAGEKAIGQLAFFLCLSEDILKRKWMLRNDIRINSI